MWEGSYWFRLPLISGELDSPPSTDSDNFKSIAVEGLANYDLITILTGRIGHIRIEAGDCI